MQSDKQTNKQTSKKTTNSLSQNVSRDWNGRVINEFPGGARVSERKYPAGNDVMKLKVSRVWLPLGLTTKIN